jgi:hypothetical protein
MNNKCPHCNGTGTLEYKVVVPGDGIFPDGRMLGGVVSYFKEHPGKPHRWYRDSRYDGTINESKTEICLECSEERKLEEGSSLTI